MDASGARLLGELTGNNVENNMAVLLDDEVYTAPNLMSRQSQLGWPQSASQNVPNLAGGAVAEGGD